jgi:hypothetical protein
MDIYVLPSEPGVPPRAMVGQITPAEEGFTVIGELATWSRDMGMWLIEERPVPPELGEAITAHAKSLGVEW